MGVSKPPPSYYHKESKAEYSYKPERKSNNKFNNWRYNRMEKRWSKMVNRAENESSQFVLGFALGLLANETILMPPQLVLAAPLTPIFKGLVSRLPSLDAKFHSGTFLLCDSHRIASVTK
jgi:hypothetical protein